MRKNKNSSGLVVTQTELNNILAFQACQLEQIRGLEIKTGETVGMHVVYAVHTIL